MLFSGCAFVRPYPPPRRVRAGKRFCCVFHIVFFLQVPCPELTGCPEFCNLLPHVTEDVEVKGESSHKVINIVSSCQDIVYVCIGYEYCVGNLLGRRCARFPYVIAAYAHRVCPGQGGHRILYRVTDELYRGLDREYPCTSADHLLSGCRSAGLPISPSGRTRIFLPLPGTWQA